MSPEYSDSSPKPCSNSQRGHLRDPVCDWGRLERTGCPEPVAEPWDHREPMSNRPGTRPGPSLLELRLTPFVLGWRRRIGPRRLRVERFQAAPPQDRVIARQFPIKNLDSPWCGRKYQHSRCLQPDAVMTEVARRGTGGEPTGNSHIY